MSDLLSLLSLRYCLLESLQYLENLRDLENAPSDSVFPGLDRRLTELRLAADLVEQMLESKRKEQKEEKENA